VNPAQQALIGVVQLYRWTLSPAKVFLFGPTAGCRFEPSCAEYAQQAVRVHGALQGSLLAARRVCRCHPWGGCGADPVPPKPSTGPTPPSLAWHVNPPRR
jgi:hypothetical protein